MHSDEKHMSDQGGRFLEEIDLFVSGTGGYHTYRIPALVVTSKGTILAFCEGRKHSRADYGEIDLVLRRSFDGGRNWGDLEVVVSGGARTCGNPCPVEDRATGTIWLAFCKNLADGGQPMIMQGRAPRTVWLTKSTDDGSTWAEPEEITEDVKDPAWTWYGTGPCHGIQLTSGRLALPCHYAVGKNCNENDPYHSHIVYSDDHGASWHIGGSVDEGTDECAIVETVAGALYINCRNSMGFDRRGYAWSHDGGNSFSGLAWDDRLIDPDCQGSLVRLTEEGRHDRNRVLFANSTSAVRRERLGVRVSYDECQTWGEAKTLHDGPSAYSDLAVAPDMSILSLCERGDEHPYEGLTLARFSLVWLTGGADMLERD